MSDVIPALKELTGGDDVILSVDDVTYEAHVDEEFYDPATRDKWGPIKGELTIHLTLSAGTVERHQLPSQVANIRVVENRKDEWGEPTIIVADPVYDDGKVIEVEDHSLGELQRITIDGN